MKLKDNPKFQFSLFYLNEIKNLLKQNVNNSIRFNLVILLMVVIILLLTLIGILKFNFLVLTSLSFGAYSLGYVISHYTIRRITKVPPIHKWTDSTLTPNDKKFSSLIQIKREIDRSLDYVARERAMSLTIITLFLFSTIVPLIFGSTFIENLNFNEEKLLSFYGLLTVTTINLGRLLIIPKGIKKLTSENNQIVLKFKFNLLKSLNNSHLNPANHE
jgi:hypothetical protein